MLVATSMTALMSKAQNCKQIYLESVWNGAIKRLKGSYYYYYACDSISSVGGNVEMFYVCKGLAGQDRTL